jgi:hypothetical protein
MDRGTAAWAHGHRYEGEWSDYEPHGLGTATFADGTIHEGEWERGIPNGPGARAYADGCRQRAMWFEGLAAQGVVTYPDGHLYEWVVLDRRPWCLLYHVYPDGRRILCVRTGHDWCDLVRGGGPDPKSARTDPRFSDLPVPHGAHSFPSPHQGKREAEMRMHFSPIPFSHRQHVFVDVMPTQTWGTVSWACLIRTWPTTAGKGHRFCEDALARGNPNCCIDPFSRVGGTKLPGAIVSRVDDKGRDRDTRNNLKKNDIQKKIFFWETGRRDAGASAVGFFFGSPK